MDKRQGTRDGESSSADSGQSSTRKPWPLSWIFIIILTYIALQTAFFLFLAD